MLRRTGTRSKNCAAKLRKADSVAGAHGLCSGRAFIKLSGKLPPSGGGDAGSHRREELPPSVGGDKRGQDTKYGFLSPLDTPNLPFGADTSKMCSETGLRELGSVRRFAYGTLLCPEFPLRDPPRITVRGHPVQGGRFPLRTAPLLSMVYSWSTKRPCGPLAFRRATEGSRVLRRVWGGQEGAREPYGALAPFCLRRQTAAFPPVNTGTPGRCVYSASGGCASLYLLLK